MSSSTSSPHTLQPQRAVWVRLLVTFDVIVVLAPPLHWLFGNGDPKSSLGYLIGVAFLVTLSLPALQALSADSEETTE